MSHAAQQQQRKIAIKSATSIAAGYGAEGARFGSLVASRDVVSGLRPKRKPGTGPGLSQPAEDLPASWLESHLGFESIATTHATRAAAAAAIASDLGWSAAGRERRGPGFNADVEAMTAQAIDGALRQHDESRGWPVARSRCIQGHVHISATSSVRTPYALLEARRTAGCHKPGLPIWNLLSGCSGLLFALQQARVMLQTEEAIRDEDAFVVISCDNDLSPSLTPAAGARSIATRTSTTGSSRRSSARAPARSSSGMRVEPAATGSSKTWVGRPSPTTGA